jgi:hypothetical protein
MAPKKYVCSDKWSECLTVVVPHNWHAACVLQVNSVEPKHWQYIQVNSWWFHSRPVAPRVTGSNPASKFSFKQLKARGLICFLIAHPQSWPYSSPCHQELDGQTRAWPWQSSCVLIISHEALPWLAGKVNSQTMKQKNSARMEAEECTPKIFFQEYKSFLHECYSSSEQDKYNSCYKGEPISLHKTYLTTCNSIMKKTKS